MITHVFVEGTDVSRILNSPVSLQRWWTEELFSPKRIDRTRYVGWGNWWQGVGVDHCAVEYTHRDRR